jgi:hypothetical protein
MHNATRGLAIDVPFGLVDFLEIMSLNWTGTSIWFDFLNLGYKLPPSAGTDYPLLGVPGAMRDYVQVDRPFTSQAWFDGLKAGRVFVTTGPMLEFTVNGRGMGSELHVKSGDPLLIRAAASINPDIDELSSLDLIEQGDTVRSVSAQSRGRTELHLDLTATHGTWFVLRARGKNSDVIAVSSPVYVSVDGEKFWKRSAVRSIVEKLKLRMQEIFTAGRLDGTDPYETRETFAKHWDTEQSALRERADQASAMYDDLVKGAAAAPSAP